MSTETGTEPLEQAAELRRPNLEADRREQLLRDLRHHLDGLLDVTVDVVNAHCCGALGCRRDDCQLWRVDVAEGRTRTLCPTHSVDFISKESRYDV